MNDEVKIVAAPKKAASKKKAKGRPTKAQQAATEDKLFNDLLHKRAASVGLSDEQYKAALALPVDGVADTRARDESEEGRTGRVTRDDTYMDGPNQTLSTEGMDPRFAYRWVLDQDDSGSKIMKRQQLGWEMVDSSKEKIVVGHLQANQGASRFGTVYRKSSGSQGTYLYLMKIPKERHEELQKDRDERQNLINKGIWGEHPEAAREGFYGSVTQSQSGSKTD